MATKDISQLPKDLEKIMSSVLDKSFLEEVAIWMRDTIYKRTKSGKGLNKINRAIGGATNEPLKKISDGYKEWRKGKVTGPFPASGNKSNLTFTGELLESIEYSIKNNIAEVFIPQGSHPSGLTLHELLDRVEKVRPFFGLSNTEVKILDSMISRMIRDRLRAANSK
jgi:hypothetical protein